LGKNGEPTGNFQLGMELHAKYTIFAEGSRGHLGRQLIAKYKLDQGRDPQSYSIGMKELWEIDPSRHKPGMVLHSAGWPLDDDTYGGSFMYHMENNLMAVGFVVGLDYKNPWLSPFDEFQRWKTHPNIRWYFEARRRRSASATARGVTARPAVAAEARCSRRRWRLRGRFQFIASCASAIKTACCRERGVRRDRPGSPARRAELPGRV
jgi:electron-transferring-flavoprotein dehydrogenase